MTLQQRLSLPTPKFFKKVRTVGLILAAISGAVVSAPVALPAAVLKIAGYLALAGGVATAVSQAATEGEAEKGGTKESEPVL